MDKGWTKDPDGGQHVKVNEEAEKMELGGKYLIEVLSNY